MSFLRAGFFQLRSIHGQADVYHDASPRARTSRESLGFHFAPCVESPTPVIADCPVGSMDDQGYLKVEVPTLDLAAGEQLV